MVQQTPFNFAFHQFLRQVVGTPALDGHLYVATEADFARAGNISFPYRSYFYAFGLMHEDQCRIRIGIRDFEVPKQALTLIGPGITRLWLDNNWNVQNTTFFFTPDLFGPPFYNNFLLDYLFFRAGAQHVLVLSDQEYARVKDLMRPLQQYSDVPKIAAGLMFALLEYINALYDQQGHSTTAVGWNHQLVSQFNQLLHTHFQQQKEVGFYADQLNVSAKHLSELLKQETGKSAKQSIDELVLFEAKSLLKQTAMSIKEIVYWLGYDDPSYFTRLFKSKTGVTPLAYRG
ncbi:AraC family transcriptional regulator [Spirosoma sp. 209]|uniref:helix-turn-helix domain-containing protein n=1 Tax=Spirosoma sp. 209 TaxID=1955701 RepID=UPI00098D07E8|nr:AraC family transcriptional regulator [Spirosoma sp. 209]